MAHKNKNNFWLVIINIMIWLISVRFLAYLMFDKYEYVLSALYYNLISADIKGNSLLGSIMLLLLGGLWIYKVFNKRK